MTRIVNLRHDIHGNMVVTVAKGSSGTSWTIQDERSYDVWGSVRSGATTGGPRGRYCPNLGHVQDDESGLIYMRARYYEPRSGRFISEDIEREATNWFVYGKNRPISLVDISGNRSADPQEVGDFLRFLVSFSVSSLIIGVGILVLDTGRYDLGLLMIGAIAHLYANPITDWASDSAQTNLWLAGTVALVHGAISTYASSLKAMNSVASRALGRVGGAGKVAAGFYIGYSLLLIVELMSDSMDV